MNNVWTIALRQRGCLLKITSHSNASLISSLPRAFSSWARWQATTLNTVRSSHVTLISPLARQSISGKKSCTDFSTPYREFSQSFAAQKLKVYTPKKIEQGLAFQVGGLTSHQLREIFGQNVPPPLFANRLLRVLHGRRVDGTLDLDPPPDLTTELSHYPHASADGLKWLRENFPVDEDDAIMRRIEREEADQEQDSPADLMQRAENLGLYKPQSGRYQAKLSEKEGDVFGVSELDKIRAENIKQAEKEEEELEQQINQIQKEVQEKVGTLATLPENALEKSSGEVRPPNEFEKWVLRAKNRATSKTTLEDLQKRNKSKISLLLPSFIFVSAVTALCYWYSQNWTPPKRSERIFPDMSLTFATVFAIIGVNVAIYCLWHFPPAWRILNKYFISVPAEPKAVSMVGNIFSHQTFFHLSVNMAWILLIGLSLHEDIGRGNFLALFFSTGAIASFASMANFTLRGMLHTSSLGASGAVAGVLGAYCMIHWDDKFTLIFLPKEWQEWITFRGSWFFAVLLALQIVEYMMPMKKFDHVSHITGYIVGALTAYWWKNNQQEGWKKNREKLPWFESALGLQTEKNGDQQQVVKSEE